MPGAGRTTPTYEGIGSGRRAQAWQVGNPSAVAALAYSQDQLRAKSRDLVRRNAWAAAGVEAFVANTIGTGIKPQSMVVNAAQREAIQSLWRQWCDEADAASLTDFYGLQTLACRAMLEGGECLVRLRFRRPDDGLSVALQLQLLEPEHLPSSLHRELPSGHVIRSGIEFDRLGRRVAYHLLRSHPGDGALSSGLSAGFAPQSGVMSGVMSGTGGSDTVRVPAAEIVHLFRPLRPGQIRGEPWLARALVKLHELDQYDDAELVRKKTAAMFAGFITRLAPEDNLLGEGLPDPQGVALAGLEPGTLQMLEPGEDIKFSAPADLGNSYAEFMRQQFRAVAAAMGITYEMLTGDLTQVNYSSIRAGLLEFRRRCEAIQHGVIVHQLCRPVWQAWMAQAVLEGALRLPGYARRPRAFEAVKWIPQGWQWVDPKKEFDAMQTAIRAGLLSRSQAISAFGYDAEDIDREIAADNARADSLGLVFDSDPRFDASRRDAVRSDVATAATNDPDQASDPMADPATS
jgi:lambda family phage portal protein